MNTQQLQQNIDTAKQAAIDSFNDIKQQTTDKINEVKANPKYQEEKQKVQSALNNVAVNALENSAKAADFIATKAREKALRAREKALKLKL